MTNSNHIPWVTQTVTAIMEEDVDEYRCVGTVTNTFTGDVLYGKEVQCANTSSNYGFYPINAGGDQDDGGDVPDNWRGLYKCDRCGSFSIVLVKGLYQL